MAQGTRYRFQYAVKFLCTADIPGTSQTSSSVVPGVYQTAVNIHNPNTEKILYRVKIVVTEPSKFTDDLELRPNHGTKWDCDRITLAFGPFIHGVEGFLVIESTHSLDVTAVYTAGRAGGQVVSIDVEQIHEREIVKTPGAPELDHFKVYEVERVPAEFRVRLTDQLDPGPKDAKLEVLSLFANPTRKLHAGAQVDIKDKNRHLTGYSITQPQPEPRRTIRYRNQFGQHSVDIGSPRFLLVPTQKTSDAGVFPESLDHYKCYEVIQVNTAPPLPIVTLDDQFGADQNVKLGAPRFFCLPVKKEREGAEEHDIVNAVDHLAAYEITIETRQQDIKVRDQFGERGLKVIRSVLLLVPTEKQVVVADGN